MASAWAHTLHKVHRQRSVWPNKGIGSKIIFRSRSMHSSRSTKISILAGRIFATARFALVAAVGVAGSALAHAQVTAVPPVVFSSAAALSGSNSQGASTTPDYVPSIGRIASNQRGDVFAVFQDTTSPGYNSLVEIPAGTTTQITLAKKISSSFPPSTVTVDTYGNLWFLNLAPDGYDSGVAIIPFVNGAYASGIDLSTTTLPTCSLPANTTTVPCSYPNIVASNFYGYLQLSDLAVDAAGNLFVVDWADSVAGYDASIQIVEYNAMTGADAIVLGNIPPYGSCCNGDTNGRLALDQKDNIYYVDQAHFLYSAAGSNTFSSISGFNAPSGVSSDSSGNIYVTDSGNNRVAVLPNLSGTVTPSSAYTLVSGTALGYTPYYSVGVDGYGNVTIPASSNGSHIFRAQAGDLNFGSIAVGSTTAASPLSLYFNAAETMGSFTVTGPFAVVTNSCPNNTTYMIGQSCAITINYKATAAGPQTGTVTAYSHAGALLGTARLYGSGTAALVNVDPGVVSAIGTTWTAPSAIAVDAAGNTYVADKTTGSIYKNGGTTAIATGFSSPSSIVVDGLGDLYVGDAGNNRIVDVPYSGTAYGTNTVIYTGLSGPSGLAIDASGNLYVADSGNGRVLLLASGGSLPAGSNVSYVGSSVSSTGTLKTNFTKPVAVAADTLGNVYVADSGTIVKVGIKSGVTTTIATGLSVAAAVAVDPGGNVYYADSGTKTITRLPNVAGTVTGSGATVFAPAVVTVPAGIAFDASGNLYAVDTTNAAVRKVTRTSGSLSFGNVVQNVASSPLTATLFNSGTAAATLANPYQVASGTNTADFTIQSSSTCANSGSIATGTSCNVVEVFKPTTTTAESSTLAFTNNAATLALSGTGVVLVNATITGPTSIAYGAPGTYTASVTPNIVSPYTVNFTPAGGGTPYTATVTIGTGTPGTGTFTSPAGLPAGSYTISLVGTVGSASVTVTSAVLTIVGNSFTRAYGVANPTFTCKSVSGIVNGDTVGCSGTTTATTASPAGTYTITPTISGAAAVNYTIAPPPTSTYGTLTITLATVNVTLVPTAAASVIGTILPGVPVTLTSTVSSLTAGGAVPTGTVTFENVTYLNSITNLTPDSGSSNPATVSGAGKAAMITSTLATGAIFVEGCYSGDKNYAPVCSIATSVTISNPTFTMTINPQTLVIPQGQFAAAQLTITPIGNYTAPISLSCSGLPLETTCAFAPSTVTLSSPNNSIVTMVITTTAATAALHRPAPWGRMGGSAAFALMVGVFAGWRRRRFKAGMATFVLVALFGLLPITGCGNGLNEPNFYTPPGTYPSVVITASSNSTGVVVPVTLRLSVTK
jgi:sugar lactone lactonase YvrE